MGQDKSFTPRVSLREACEHAEAMLRDGGTFPIRGLTWRLLQDALKPYRSEKQPCVCGRTTPHGITPEESCHAAPCLFPSEKGENDAKDAARYRWWRERFSGDDDAMDEINDAFSKGVDSPEDVDAAIDAAMDAAPQVPASEAERQVSSPAVAAPGISSDKQVLFSSWQDPRSWDVTALQFPGVVITCATNADVKKAEQLFNDLLARAEKAEAAVSATLPTVEGRKQGKYRLVYNKATRMIDKVGIDGSVVESYDPPPLL